MTNPYRAQMVEDMRRRIVGVLDRAQLNELSGIPNANYMQIEFLRLAILTHWDDATTTPRLFEIISRRLSPEALLERL